MTATAFLLVPVIIFRALLTTHVSLQQTIKLPPTFVRLSILVPYLYFNQCSVTYLVGVLQIVTIRWRDEMMAVSHWLINTPQTVRVLFFLIFLNATLDTLGLPSSVSVFLNLNMME